MAKSPKKKSKAAPKRQRRERRFEPRPTANRWAVIACGILGATAMGAGTWGQFGPAISGTDADPFKYAPWILAGGAILVGIAIWFGTSGEPAIRVGDPGVAIEKGGVRRIPWHQVERVELDGNAVVVKGKDELGQSLVIRARIESHTQAAAWIVREARQRIASLVAVPDEMILPLARDDAGDILSVEAVQVVGRHCAESGKVIAYEPDARICTRCERVYHRSFMPVTCACGNSLAGARGKKSDDVEGEDDAAREVVATAQEPEVAVAARAPEAALPAAPVDAAALETAAPAPLETADKSQSQS